MNGPLLREVGAAITDRTARGIAAAVGRLISSGRLPVGTRLPTVRELSKELGVSPTTVSEFTPSSTMTCQTVGGSSRPGIRTVLPPASNQDHVVHCLSLIHI